MEWVGGREERKDWEEVEQEGGEWTISVCNSYDNALYTTLQHELSNVTETFPSLELEAGCG